MGVDPSAHEMDDESEMDSKIEESKRQKAGLFSLMKTAFADYSELLHARLDLLRANIAETTRRLFIAGLVVALCIMLCLAAFITLLFGMVLALAPLIGALPAALIVSLAAAGIGAIACLIAIKRFTQQFSDTLAYSKYKFQGRNENEEQTTP